MIFIAWSQQTQDWSLETRIYQIIKVRDYSALQVRTIKNVVTQRGRQKQIWRENGLKG